MNRYRPVVAKNISRNYESFTFRAMVQQAKLRVVVADSTKLGCVSPALVCPISEINLLITDSRATDKSIAPFLERGIDVKRV
jgi:DeoR family transcriptional regulator of aga operon